jgi:glycosyltransferase involved in cell wall biosynthesis
MDIDQDVQDLVLPSKRQRVIIWPKAHESMWAKAVPLIESIKLAWDRIKPCTIYAIAADNSTKSWLLTLPEEIRNSCLIYPRVPRQKVLEVMKQARVMLAPSLVDGVPNVLYEAMVYGAFPIVSPLNTIVPIISQPQNTIFARNLYPQEIAEALVKAMTDDDLIDSAAKNNLILAKEIASRQVISNRLISYYFHVANHYQ